MLETPKVIQVDAQDAAVIHLRIARRDMMAQFGPAVGELMAALAAQGEQPAGPVFAHHLRMTADRFDFELGVPVAAAIQPAGRMRPGQLPAARLAHTVYTGPYEGLPAAWSEFDRWMTTNGHRQAGDLWEVYATGPQSGPDPATWRTELNRPLLD